jgi:hypothetical protein
MERLAQWELAQEVELAQLAKTCVQAMVDCQAIPRHDSLEMQALAHFLWIH